jgi:hypothetical protein
MVNEINFTFSTNLTVSAISMYSKRKFSARFFAKVVLPDLIREQTFYFLLTKLTCARSSSNQQIWLRSHYPGYKETFYLESLAGIKRYNITLNNDQKKYEKFIYFNLYDNNKIRFIGRFFQDSSHILGWQSIFAHRQ